MKPNFLKIGGFLLLLALVALGYLNVPTETQQEVTPPNPTAAPAPTVAGSGDGIMRVVESAAIKNYDKIIYRGPVDLSRTIERIRAGESHSHRNDGSVFGNREGLLPSRPRGYYREYVHPTDGLGGPGPQRIVVGNDGDWWYTPDHYASFIPLGKEKRR